VYWVSHKLSPLQLVGKTNNVTASTAGWSLGAAVDVFVAMGIVWQLLRLNVSFTSTKGLIRKFLLSTVLSGCLTAFCALFLIILLSTNKYAFLIFATTFGKIYGITVFANLLFVSQMQQQSTVVINIPTWMGNHSSSIGAYLAKARPFASASQSQSEKS
jgi:hypothetical protein